jgi:DNA-binding LacI/PurR family transcriptional regulator
MSRSHHLHAELVPGAGPKYNQIHEYLRGQIERQKLVNGEYLPPENQLAANFGVSIGTIKKALRKLKAGNYVQRRKGDGTRVSFSPRTPRDRKAIVVLLGTVKHSFHAEIYSGIQSQLEGSGCKPILIDTESSSEKERESLVKYGSAVGGFLIVPAKGNRNHACYGQLLADGVPFVFIDCYLPDFNVDAVVADNCAGGYLATKCLLEAGHRRIAVLGVTDSTSIRDRVEGYKTALSEFGLAFDSGLLLPVEVGGYDGVYTQTEAFLAERPGLTAAFCLRDDAAWGCLQRLTEMGIRVPDEFSIVGYDDNEEICSRLRPRLTTVRQPRMEMGAAAARILVQKLDGRSASREGTISLPVQLVERESVATAPAQAASYRPMDPVCPAPAAT